MKNNKTYIWKDRILPIAYNGFEVHVDQEDKIEFELDKVKLLDTSTHTFLHLFLTIKQGWFKTKSQQYDLKQKSFKMTIPIEVNGEDDVDLRNQATIDCYGLSINELMFSEQVEFSQTMRKYLTINPRIVQDILHNAFPDDVYVFNEDYLNKQPFEKEIKKVNGQKQIIRGNEDLSLMGWDMAIVTSFATMNERIIRDKNFPDHIEYNGDDPFLKKEISFDFSKWQLTADGGGKNVTLRADVSGGSFSIAGAEFNVDTEQPGYVTIQINLAAINADVPKDSTGKNDGTGYKLQIDTESTDEHDPITVLHVGINFVDFNNDAQGYLEEVCNEAFNKYQAEIMQIFSFYQLNETSNTDGFQFLKPKVALYGTSVSSNGDLEQSAFGIQSMTESSDSPQSQNIDLRLVAASEQPNAVALNKLVYMHHTFDKVQRYAGFAMPDDFTMDDDNYKIYNNKKVQLLTYTASDDPKKRRDDDPWEGCPGFVDAGNWSLELVNDQLVLQIVDLTFASDGHKLHVNYESTSNIILKSGTDTLNQQYKNVISVEPAQDPVLTMEVTKDEWLSNGELVLDIMSSIALGVIGGAIGGMLGKAFTKYIAQVIKESTSDNRFVLALKDLFEVAETEINDQADEIAQGTAEKRELVLDDVKNTPEEVSAGSIEKETKNPVTLSRRLWRYAATNAASIIIGGVIGGVGQGVGQHMSDIVENQYNGQFSLNPQLDPMTAEIVNTLLWPEQSEFSLKTAQLLGGVYLMGGDFK